jgi:enoyl-CoA hydratase
MPPAMVAVPPLRVERQNGAVHVTLDRPPLNLLTPEFIAALHDCFTTLTRDPEVRVAVLTGSGRAFTAGMDVKFLMGLDVATAKAFITTLHEAIHAVHEAPFPVVAVLNGPALGAGFELAMACDLRVAADTATLGLPEVRVGVPSVIEAALLPALVGPGRAAEMLFLGDPIPASQALAWGLVNVVVPADGVAAAATRIVDGIRACGPRAIRLQKELLIRWRNTDLGTAMRYGINAFASAYATDEPRLAMRAFLEKRPPPFA